MKNLFKTCVVAVISGFLMVSAFSTTGCKKDKPTEVLITVQDTGGFRVSGALVRVYAEPSTGDTGRKTLFDESKYTDGSGQVVFDYSGYTKPGQAGFVVLSIQASKLDQLGVGVVRVEEEKRVEKTVSIQ